MARCEQIDTSCLCHYTLTIRNQTIGNELASMKDNFNCTPSIHEIDEEDDEEDNVKECLNDALLSSSNHVKEYAENAGNDRNDDEPDDESTYSVDSFCSDVSYQETEDTNVTTRPVRTRSPSPLKLRVGEDHIAEAKDEEDTVSAELSHVDYASDITGSLENFTQSEKLGGTICKRRNMSFTDEEMRKIERENELLLRKIMAQHRPRNKTNQVPQQPRVSSSAINRKKLQKKIDGDNMLLLRRIQQAKPRVVTNSTATGYRITLFQ